MTVDEQAAAAEALAANRSVTPPVPPPPTPEPDPQAADTHSLPHEIR